ncbi:MAG TPA: TlpA disulfide reductase family protein [Vicinamibacterales bacterium]|jgi:thiol-disulfide isomerase/thioredoxin
MTARRALAILLAAVAASAAIVLMFRYTKQVETSIRKAPASRTSVRLLKDRAAVLPLTGVDLDGRPVSTAAFRGKVVLVNFWATWCPPCREEIPDLIELQARYKDTLQIVGIAQDSGSAADVQRFAVEHKMNYPSLLSTPEIEKLFPPVSALPTSFFLDREGRLAQKHVGMLNPSLTDLETQALAGTNPDLTIVDAEDEDKARVASAAQANKIPGVDLAVLSPEKRAKVLAALNSEHCSCGCGLTVAQCRVDDPTCNVSLPLAQQLMEKIASAK